MKKYWLSKNHSVGRLEFIGRYFSAVVAAGLAVGELKAQQAPDRRDRYPGGVWHEDTYYVPSRTYTMTNTPVSNTMLWVFLNGLLQDAGRDYTVAGSTITFLADVATQERATVKIRYQAYV